MESGALDIRAVSLRRGRDPGRALQELRPLGEAYLARRFGRSLSRADAEDAVAEVVIRLHRKIEGGQAPRNLRAAFFTSVRNAAIDQLRSRKAKPTVALEAAAETAIETGSPGEEAERREDMTRMQEALGRMRPNYREAIVLRFGVGLTVPEIGERLGISLPAAKKLVLRATEQMRKRVAAIEGHEFCPQMREAAKRSLLAKQLAGLATEGDRRVLKAHFEHCGSCKTFLAELHRNLHDLSGAALLTGIAGPGAERSHPFAPLAEWLGGGGEAVQGVAQRLRTGAYKATVALQPTDAGGVSALGTTAQKVAALCGAATATAATCVASGVIGPGIDAGAGSQAEPAANQTPAPVVREAEAPRPEVPASAPEPANLPQPAADSETGAAQAQPQAAPPPSESEPAPSPSEEVSEEFGFETSAASEPAPEPAAAPEPTPAPTPSSPPPTSVGGGGESFGFGG
jgi:RNA polymerase sigma factor (sigma-70 family)